MNHWNEEIQGLGKPEWGSMLQYTADLHRKSTNPATAPFPYPWESIGIGYVHGPAFGHWDIVHAVMDAIPYEPEHARQQLLNNLQMQTADGMVPGSIYLKGGKILWSTVQGHPPVWPAAVDDHCILHGDLELLGLSYGPLIRQIGWFETQRSVQEGGFYYTDIVNHLWESGVDDGVRFETLQSDPGACVDATSHVYQLYRYAEKWARALKKHEASDYYAKKADYLQAWITQKLFDEETGLFHDQWAVGKPECRHLALEGIWPVVVGAATEEQAMRVIDGNLLNPRRFFTEHPAPTLAVEDRAFELRMWRGPSWNSITYWAARGCLRYGRGDAAGLLLGKALDASAKQFERYGTIFEFYHPHGGDPLSVERKPYTPYNAPCSDYLGHNPLIAMALMWETTQ